MTLIMGWREGDLDRVWIVSDSRLSRPGRIGHERLTDSGAKLLAAELVMRRQTPLLVFGTPVARRTVAFAYAGSALVALQSYAAVLPLWGHLQTVGQEILPPIAALAEHLGRFVAAYAHEVSGAHGLFQACECAVIGFDDRLGAIDGWSVRAEEGVSEQAALRRLDLAPGAIEMIGSGAEVARARLASLTREPGGAWHREPLAMIRAALHGEAMGHTGASMGGDVGGGVQIGYVSPEGFELMYDVVPGTPFAEMRFRGFDFSEISRVGEAFVNLPGLA
ncbi:hypothetical protein [Sphingopyxis sp.]|uniref:hypothetical protein n=1 Tax=Sphingopyxis sp. TaxID=1908224 RepID=UPI003D0AC7E2